MIRSVLISLVSVLGPSVVMNTATAAQSDADSLAAQVDEVIAGLEHPDQPGCQCAIMRDAEVVYSRAFGMANLEQPHSGAHRQNASRSVPRANDR